MTRTPHDSCRLGASKLPHGSYSNASYHWPQRKTWLMRSKNKQSLQSREISKPAFPADSSIVALGAVTVAVGAPWPPARDAVVTAGTLRVGRSNVGIINDKRRSAVFQCSSAAVSGSLGAAMLFSVHAMEAPLMISLPHGNILLIDK